MIGSAAVYSRPALDLARYVCVILACAEAIAGPNSNNSCGIYAGSMPVSICTGPEG